MDIRQKRLLESFFSSDKKFERVYLQPPTSQKNVPQGMTELDRMLGNMKIEQESKSMERLDRWLAERRQTMQN